MGYYIVHSATLTYNIGPLHQSVHLRARSIVMRQKLGWHVDGYGCARVCVTALENERTNPLIGKRSDTVLKRQSVARSAVVISSAKRIYQMLQHMP